MKSVEAIKSATRAFTTLKIENEVGKLSSYFGIAVLIVLAITSFTFEISKSGQILYDSTFGTSNLVIVLLYFLCDMTLSYHFVE